MQRVRLLYSDLSFAPRSYGCSEEASLQQVPEDVRCQSLGVSCPGPGPDASDDPTSKT